MRRCWMVGWIALVAGLAVALCRAPAAAGDAKPAAACMDVQAEGVPAAVVPGLTRALRAALAEDGAFTRVEPKASLMDLRLLLDCQAASPSCWVAVARTVQARVLFVAEVRPGAGGHVVRFQRIDGASGTVTDAVEASLGGGDLARALHDRAADFFAALRGGVVRVLSEPSASEVLVDGEPRGTTPQSLKLPAGHHRIEVRRGGYRAFQEEVDVVAGGAADVEARLQELPREVPTVEPRPAPARGRLGPATYVTIVAAGVALGAGVVMAGLERQTQSDYNGLDLTRRADVDRRFQLESRGKSLSVGANVAFALGGIAVVVAAVLVWRDLRVRREAGPPRVTFGPGAVAVSWGY